MSKDKPEVGDVWIDKETCFRMTFIMVSDYYCEYIEHHTKLVESFDIYRIDANYNGWKKGKKYLGKSKANINELFKTDEKELLK